MLTSRYSSVVVLLFHPFFIMKFLQILPPTQSQPPPPPLLQSSSKPTIIDTDYGLFSDDIFALGIALGASPSPLNLQMIITTSHDAYLSAKCVARHISQTSKRIPVGVGVNGTASSCVGHCCNPSFINFNLRDDCEAGRRYDESDGVAFAATLMESSGRNDWIYVTLGPLSSLKSLADRFPDAARRIESVVMMGGNYCRGTDEEKICPWEGYCAPFEELNVSCDVDAANFVVFNENWEVYIAGAIPGGNKLGREHIAEVKGGSGRSHGAMAVMNMFELWNKAQCRIEDDGIPNIDTPSCQRPLERSLMMNDGTAVMIAIQLVQHSKQWLDFYDLPGMQFTSSGMTSLPDTLDDTTTDVDEKPPGDKCPRFVDARFDVNEQEGVGERRQPRPIKVLVGFESEEQRVDYFSWQLAYIQNDDDDDPTCSV